VDHQSYKLEASDSSNMEMLDISGEEPEDVRGEPLFSKFNDMECSADNELEPAQYLLLPAYVLGFALGKRQWGKTAYCSHLASGLTKSYSSYIRHEFR